jgi:hypothetical protein
MNINKNSMFFVGLITVIGSIVLLIGGIRQPLTENDLYGMMVCFFLLLSLYYEKNEKG